jgi:trehalose/maltose hydrolase-like predicted phosphorylase
MTCTRVCITNFRRADWDEEIWFFPFFNWFYPAIARQIVDYRVELAEQARENAAKPLLFPFAGSAYTGNRTFSGLAYPWFSALTVRICACVVARV